MGNSILTSDENSNCGCGSDNTGTSFPQLDYENPPIVVRNIEGALNGNVVRKYSENGVIVYQLEDFTLVKPILSLTNDAPDIVEVGATVALVEFSGNITAGSYPIASRTLTPDPGGVILTAPFTFEKTNVKRTTPGTAELHTLQATDDHGNQTTVQSGVVVKHSFYQGYSDLADLTQAQIKALVNKTLNDNIIQEYGGSNSYVVPGSPATPKYIYWVGVVGTQAIAGALLGGLGLALSTRAQVAVTNSNDGSIVTDYFVIRTANKFNPGTYNITLS